MRLAFTTYLKGELGKLASTEDVGEFATRIPPGTLAGIGLPEKADELRDLFGTQQRVDEWVDAQDDGILSDLTEAIDSQWRHNGVAKKIERHGKWKHIECPIEEVRARQAERPYANIFERNEFLLIRLVEDAQLGSLPPYCCYTVGASVAHKTLLAKSDGDYWRIIDGVHRAYQLVLNGEQKLSLCVPDET